jgi:hypothetical protein
MVAKSKARTRSSTAAAPIEKKAKGPRLANTFGADALAWLHRDYDMVLECVGSPEQEVIEQTLREADEPNYDQFDDAERAFRALLTPQQQEAFDTFSRLAFRFNRWLKRCAYVHGIEIGKRFRHVEDR